MSTIAVPFRARPQELEFPFWRNCCGIGVDLVKCRLCVHATLPHHPHRRTQPPAVRSSAGGGWCCGCRIKNKKELKPWPLRRYLEEIYNQLTYRLV